MYFAKVCRAVVSAFEPNPVARRYLNRNVEVNGLAALVSARDEALSDAAGAASLEITRGNLGLTRVVAGAGAVAVVRLDDVHRGRARLIKIDVEGKELAVLEGAQSMLASHRPVVVAEAQDRDAADSIHAFLRAFGYRRFPVPFAVTPTFVFVPGVRDYLRLLATPTALRRTANAAVSRLRRR